MDGRRIGCLGDHSIECIDLANEMTLSKTADGRIAAHRTDRIDRKADERDFRPHPRCDTRGFDTRVATTDYDDIKGVHRLPSNPFD